MALTPEYLSEVPKSLIDIYQKLEDFIIEDIARRIAKAGTITDTAKWQTERANEFGIAIETIKKEIAKINKMSYAEVDKLFKEAAITSIENDNVLYEQAKLTPMHYSKIPGLNDYLIAAVKQTKGELRNISQSLGFIISTPTGAKAKKLTAIYQDVLDLVQMQVSSGVIDYNTAVRNAVKDLARSGIRRIDYESGWHNRVDVAVKRATLTGVNQMSRHLTNLYHDEMIDKNEQYVEVTAHAGARPDHAEWQGKVYKVVGSSKRYPNLAEATGLGTGAGLGGWNCRHSYFPFIPDISIRTYTDEQLENIDPEPFEYKGITYTYYEATQKQRQLETRMRATKRELIAYDAIDDKDAFYKASLQLKNQKEAYEEFSKAIGIRQKKDRTQVLGYDRSIAQKSIWSVKKNKSNEELSKLQDINPPLAKRHRLESINKNSTAKDKNTIILPEVDYLKDIEEIKRGLYNKVNNMYGINGRWYSYHDNRFYPEKGEGFITLNRREYKLLILLKTQKNNPKLDIILSNISASEEEINKINKILLELR